MEYVILDGEILNRKEAKIDIEDRGYQFGDGVYEVIRVYNGTMFTRNEHLHRLIESAEKIGMKLPYTLEEMGQQLEELVEQNKLRLGTVYLQFTRGVSPRGHAFPSSNVPLTYVAYTRTVPRPASDMETGVKTITNEDIRWLRCDIKSLNLLGNLLAKQKAKEAGCFEAIGYRDDIVTEGSLSNISIVKNGKVITHPANHFILNGITRQQVLQLCHNNGIPFEEKTFTLHDLFQADEIFLTGTTVEVMPIVEVDGKAVGAGKPGSTTKRLQQLFKQEIINQCGGLE
ncbi:D-amino-acid transaminase [Bacillus aquiflavi]|uniref:D-alanine aminotransferase n=1 Tax=Bacillus aquiflavi TaxID=2672567 RepID=A0A6B3VXG4_9BACI|nr:D-amino-acid transaminase [Bacillus aquiflavi]MBA4537721.1 D-amino-acid transaminase [Bacillus aquiflavi]NEY81978.1 D-amino-acid transaminase [Bacillus aquiflavi]UAC47599.1 D-amino-acid transaminase [Bacillus aquiflavi]